MTSHDHDQPGVEWLGDSGAVSAVWAWLRKSYQREMDEAFKALLNIWWPDARIKPRDVPPTVQNFIMANVNETVLIEEKITVNGQSHRPIDLVLEQAHKALDAAQTRYVEGLAQAPMRLYQVSRVNAGKSLTLVDLMVPESPPVTVIDRRLSLKVKGGEAFGARVVGLATHQVLARAYLPIHASSLSDLVALLNSVAARSEGGLAPNASFARAIGAYWTDNMLVGRVPNLVDPASGAPVMLITDFYEVGDADALENRLREAPHVEQTSPSSWIRHDQRNDRSPNMLASIYRDEKTGELCVFYQSEPVASESKAWFEATVGRSVRFLRRECKDPAEFMQKAMRDPEAARAELGDQQVSLSPDQTTTLVQQMYESTYEKWVDQPIPMLEGKTPRQACSTAAGRERVRGLLNMYESNELRLAKTDGRRPASFKFLWQQVGMKK